MKRREFLKNSAAAAIGTQMAFAAIENLIQGVISSTYAQSLSSLPKKLITLFSPEGTPQYLYNLPLVPFAGQQMVYANGIANDFANHRLVYSTTPLVVNGVTYNMPSFWKTALPTANGGTVAARELFKNMGILRGVKTEKEHENAKRLFFRPNSNANSIQGIVADASLQDATTAIPAVAIQYMDPSWYRSTKAGLKLLQNLGTSSPLENLLGPYRASTAMSALLSSREHFSQAYQTVLQSMQQRAAQSNANSSVLFSNLQSFESLVREDFGDLSSIYNSYLQKYQSLIHRSANINDIITSPIAPADFGASGMNLPYAITYGGTGGNPSTEKLVNTDLRSILQSTSSVSFLAESCAIAQFLIEKNCSSAISLYSDAPVGLDIRLANGQTKDTIVTMDQHSEGSAYSLVSMLFMFKAISSCVYELTNVLRAQGQFSETVIQIASEFSRSPRISCGGSDHGFTAQCSTIISGAIEQPFIAGNIRREPNAYYYPTTDYAGTFGDGAINEHPTEGSTILQQEHLASSICSAVGVASPTPSFGPVFGQNSRGKIVSFIGNGDTNES